MDMDVSQPTSAEPNELERLIFAEENALKHLIRSNEQLQTLDPDLADADYREAVQENKEVIARKQARVEELRTLLSEAYGTTHALPLPVGTSRPISNTAPAPAQATPAPSADRPSTRPAGSHDSSTGAAHMARAPDVAPSPPGSDSNGATHAMDDDGGMLL